jgi:hypothetical protein
VIGWLSGLILSMSVNIIMVSSVARPVKAALFYRAGDLKKVTKISPRRGRVISRALFIEIALRLVGLDWRGIGGFLRLID